MADVKISALPLASTPLAGTEVLPIVQSATTDQVSVANLTAGRAVSAASLTLTTTPLAVGSGGTGLTSLTAGYIPFGAGASAFGNDSNLFWDNSNKRLGIGTSSPSANLHSSTASAAANFRFDGNNFAGGNYYGSSVNTSGVFTGLDSGGGFVINVRDAGYFQVSTSNTPRMTLNASGNLGIGISSPGGRLDVSSADDVPVYFRNSSAIFRIRPYVTSYGTTQLAALNGAASAYAPLAIGGSYTTIESSGVEQARIDSSGNLLVGTTDTSIQSGAGFKFIQGSGNPYMGLVGAASTGAANAYHLYSTGAAAYRFYVSYAGQIYATGTTITGISDRRLKENIVDLDVGLDALLALKPRKFDWKAGKGKDIKGDRGWIADEFQQVFPDLIDEWLDPAPEGEEPYKSVRPDIIPVVVKAIQELAAKVAALEAKK